MKHVRHVQKSKIGGQRLRPGSVAATTFTVTLFLMVLLGGSLAAQAADAARQTPAENAAAALADHAPGVQIAVFRGGLLVDHGEAGWMDAERRVPVDRETSFPVYSAAKAWTTVALARLAERGRLNPEAPVSSLVPRFRATGGDPTLMQLVTHQGGVRHYASDEEAVRPQPCASVGEALEFFADDPLVFEPGTDTGYSSWGFVLLSAALESVAGQPFDELLRAEVLEAASMSSARSASRPLVHAAASYDVTDAPGVWRRIEIDPSCKWGAGGYFANATDVAGFYSALFSGRLVSEPMVQRIVRPGADGRYRFGGRSAGGTSLILGDSDAGVVVAMVANARISGDEVDALVARVLEEHTR